MRLVLLFILSMGLLACSNQQTYESKVGYSARENKREIDRDQSFSISSIVRPGLLL